MTDIIQLALEIWDFDFIITLLHFLLLRVHNIESYLTHILSL